MKTANKKLVKFLIIFYCLASIAFYTPVFAPFALLQVLHISLTLLLIFILIKDGAAKLKASFTLPVKILIFSVLFSLISATVIWDQQIMGSILVIVQYLSFILYFYLLVRKVEFKWLEDTVIQLGALTVFLYWVSLAVFPTILFGLFSADEISGDRGFARLYMGGFGFVYLAFFICVNRYLTTTKFNWLIIAAFIFSGIILTLTRQTIVLSLLLGVLLLANRYSIWKKLVFLCCIAAVLYFLLPVIPGVQKLVEKTMDQTKSAKEDVRYQSGTYFLTSFSPNLFAAVFGNGDAIMGASKGAYGTFMTNLKAKYFFQSDVGFIGLYSKFGVLSVLSWVIIFFKIFFKKYTKHYIYLYYFFGLILLTGLTSSMTFNSDYIPAIAIALYIGEAKNVNIAVSTLKADGEAAI